MLFQTRPRQEAPVLTEKQWNLQYQMFMTLCNPITKIVLESIKIQ